MDINSLKTLTIETPPSVRPPESTSADHSASGSTAHVPSSVMPATRIADHNPSADPVKDTSSSQEQPNLDAQNLKQHVDKMNSVMQAMDKDLQFALDDRLKNEMVVKVVNRKNGHLIRQYPAEEIINMMQRLDEAVQGVLVDNKA